MLPTVFDDGDAVFGNAVDFCNSLFAEMRHGTDEEALGISIHTVNFHIKNLYKKLGIRSRSEMFAKLSTANFSSSDTREGDSKNNL